MILDWLKPVASRVNSWLKKPVSESRLLSRSAYDPAKYEKELAARDLTLDSELSSENTKVYKDSKGNAKVAFRGTSSFRDLLPDLDILQGKRKHKDFDDAVAVSERAKKKYKNVQLTGHSLGGTKALYASKKLGLPAEVYNPGSSIFKPERYDDPNIVIHKAPLDFIAAGVSGKSVKLDPSSFLRKYHHAL